MKRLYISLVCIFLSLQLPAQIDPTVEVSRRYDVKAQDVTKPAINLSIADSLERFDVSFDYSIFNRQYKELYDFIPYEAALLKTVGVAKPSFFYARLGTQYPLMPSAELYLQGGKNKGLHASLSARHDSFWGDVQSVSPYFEEGNLNVNRMDNSAGLNLGYAWETGEFKLDVSYSYDKYKYSWSEQSLTDDHKNSGLNLSANLNSAHTEESSVYYDITFNYRNLAKNFTQTFAQGDPSVSELGENYLKFDGYVGASFDKHRIFIDMNIEFNSYSKLRDFSSGVVELSPIYQLRNKWLNAKLGITFGNYFMLKGDVVDSDMENKSKTNFFPDIDARFALVDKILWIRAVATGGNDLNSYVKMLDSAPMVDPGTTMQLGTRPLDSKLAIETLILGKLNINLFGAYVIYNDHAIFKPAGAGAANNRIVASYQDMNLFSGGVEAFWESQDVTAGGTFRYNSYKDKDGMVVTDMPKTEANAFLRYNFRERIIAEADLNYRSQVSGYFEEDASLAPQQYSVPAIMDLSFNLNVRLTKHLSVYGKIGNILNSKNQYVPMYLEPGRNYGGGVCISF